MESTEQIVEYLLADKRIACWRFADQYTAIHTPLHDKTLAVITGKSCHDMSSLLGRIQYARSPVADFSLRGDLFHIQLADGTCVQFGLKNKTTSLLHMKLPISALPSCKLIMSIYDDIIIRLIFTCGQSFVLVCEEMRDFSQLQFILQGV